MVTAGLLARARAGDGEAFRELAESLAGAAGLRTVPGGRRIGFAT